MRRTPTRLDKVLREALGWSRAEVTRALEAGRVRLVEANAEVDPRHDALVFEGDRVRVDGAEVEAKPSTGVWMLHKPLGVVSTTRDPHGHPDLGPWLRTLPPRFFPVGRLDADTSGLLLATDDGDLAHLLLRPRQHLAKTYHLQVTGALPPGDERLARLLGGVVLDDGPARALEVEVVEVGAVSVVALAIDEGRNRLVRRMARAVGFDLLELHRVRVGPQGLGTLPVGASRALTAAEYEGLWAAVGGREAVVAAQVAALARRAERARAEGQPEARLEAWLQANR